jgi:hypothetical protein
MMISSSRMFLAKLNHRPTRVRKPSMEHQESWGNLWSTGPHFGTWRQTVGIWGLPFRRELCWYLPSFMYRKISWRLVTNRFPGPTSQEAIWILNRYIQEFWHRGLRPHKNVQNAKIRDWALWHQWIYQMTITKGKAGTGWKWRGLIQSVWVGLAGGVEA